MLNFMLQKEDIVLQERLIAGASYMKWMSIRSIFSSSASRSPNDMDSARLTLNFNLGGCEDAKLQLEHPHGIVRLFVQSLFIAMSASLDRHV